MSSCLQWVFHKYICLVLFIQCDSHCLIIGLLDHVHLMQSVICSDLNLHPYFSACPICCFPLSLLYYLLFHFSLLFSLLCITLGYVQWLLWGLQYNPKLSDNQQGVYNTLYITTLQLHTSIFLPLPVFYCCCVFSLYI